ncbi:methyltransferase domain-containing protein [Phenylobacterium sp.]|uniref:methyltransferase domain-containing protein n=1 Tax=Phenylobacterium sp. TaxID=1871053 RepID=UPI0035ADAFBA
MIRDRLPALVDAANKRGLEIGPLNRPIVARANGPIEYIDRASREELQQTYGKNADVDPNEIVEVDHVWGDMRLIDCVGGQRIYDYLIAAHVIEHVPDLVGWLREIAEVLVDGGLAAFIIPDKRYTFDVRRRTSSDAEVVDAYVRRQRRPSARQVFDCFHNFKNLTPHEDPSRSPPDGGSPERARELFGLCEHIEAHGEYVDAHCWVFTPRSFLQALSLASQLDLLPFEVLALEPTAPNADEFLAILRRSPDGRSKEAQRQAFEASVRGLDLPEEDSLDTLAELQALRAEARKATARAAAIEASTSWRITAPLRAAVMFTRRLKRRAAAG